MQVALFEGCHIGLLDSLDIMEGVLKKMPYNADRTDIKVGRKSDAVGAGVTGEVVFGDTIFSLNATPAKESLEVSVEGTLPKLDDLQRVTDFLMDYFGSKV